MKIKEAGMNKVKKYSYEQRAKYIIKTIIEAGLISGRLLKTGEGSIVHYYNVLKKNMIYMLCNHTIIYGRFQRNSGKV